jgi:hypothetical protein
MHEWMLNDVHGHGATIQREKAKRKREKVEFEV